MKWQRKRLNFKDYILMVKAAIKKNEYATKKIKLHVYKKILGTDDHMPWDVSIVVITFGFKN